MSCNPEEDQRDGWRSWVAAGVASAAVFVLLMVLQVFSFWTAIAIAAGIVVVGLVALRWP